MKSFGEFFSSLLNMNMFLRTDSKSSKESLDKTVHEKEEVQETKTENNEKQEEKEETFEFIEIAESTFEEDVEHVFVTNF